MKTIKIMKMAILVMLSLAFARSGFSAQSAAMSIDTRVSNQSCVVADLVVIGSPSGKSTTEWNTKLLSDGWEVVTSEGCSTNLLVLNECEIRGGRLTSSETWGSEKIYILKHNVVIPSGVSLNVSAGAIVKCTPGTSIEVEDGGSLVLKGAMLADIADDSVGGDTNHDGDNSAPTAMLDAFVVGAGMPELIRVVLWSDGAREGSDRWYTTGQKYGELPTLDKEGFLFEGWFTETEGGVEVTSETAVSVDALYAHWTAFAVALDSTGMTVPANGGDYSFGVSANSTWTVTKPDGATWVTLNTATGTGNGVVSFTVSGNDEGSERAATITVTSSGVSREFTVCQSGCESVATPKITPSNGTEFSGLSRRCSISCATDGATIHYTLNGKDPDISDPVYGGVSFNIFDSTIIKARAFKSGMVASPIATSCVVKKQTLADAMDIPLWTITNDADAPWTVDADEKYGSKASVRSGAIGCEEETSISTEVTGAGTLTFWWRVSCEDCPDEDTYWDYLVYIIDGVEGVPIDGESGWLQQSIKLGEGKHTIEWLYHKDDMDDEGHTGQDCGWVDSITWTPSVASSVNGMSESWLQSVGAASGAGDKTSAEIAASDPDGDGLTVEQEYVAGTDPTDPESKFTAKIEMVDGVPQITWEPDLRDDEQPRAYKTWGSKDLKTWKEVPAGKNGDYNFFKVSVEMPK